MEVLCKTNIPRHGIRLYLWETVKFKIRVRTKLCMWNVRFVMFELIDTTQKVWHFQRF